jgi:hypothetical protein
VSPEVLHELTLAEAVARYGSMDLPLRPATLDPRYVAADATRADILRPVYLSFEANGQRWMHGLHLADIAGTALKDASSPYGYGGPLASCTDAAFLAAAWAAYTAWMVRQRVVVEYVRFHPILGNERSYGGVVSDNRDVVWVDLGQSDFVAGYAKRLRQALKKADTAHFVYRELPLASCAVRFAAFYRDGMAEIQADPFFLFGDAYFEALAASGLGRVGVCQDGDDPDGRWLAAGLFLDGAGVREYHLAASSAEGRTAGASAFALHRAAMAARALGMQRLYLGGGSDVRVDNPLLFFKSAYSGHRLRYRTGSTVFDSEAYDRLKRNFPAAWAVHPERPIFYRKA